jgi:hypothetical protein
VCEEQVEIKKRLGWKHGNTPRRFLFGHDIYSVSRLGYDNHQHLSKWVEINQTMLRNLMMLEILTNDSLRQLSLIAPTYLNELDITGCSTKRFNKVLHKILAISENK